MSDNPKLLTQYGGNIPPTRLMRSTFFEIFSFKIVNIGVCERGNLSIRSRLRICFYNMSLLPSFEREAADSAVKNRSSLFEKCCRAKVLYSF